MTARRKRFVWMVTKAPKGIDAETVRKVLDSTRIYAKEDSMKAEIPQTALSSPRSEKNGDNVTFGRTKKYTAKRIPIRDSDGLPI